jgi:hypothetical protein
VSCGILLRLLLAGAFIPMPVEAVGVAIDHKEVGCVEAGKFPSLEARFDPEPRVVRARVYFKPEGWPSWYWVPMKKEGESFYGVLPKPERKLARFDYYISVLDPFFVESRTPEYAPSVVSGANACGGSKVMAVGLAKVAQVIVSGTEGIAHAPLVPAGFASDGVAGGGAGAAAAGATVAVGGAGGASAAGATAATTAAAGGGIGTTVLVVAGGVAVAGGIAAVVATRGEGGDSGDATYSGEFAGIMTWTGGCTSDWRHAGTLRMELHNTSGGLGGSMAGADGTVTVVSTTCPPPPGHLEVGQNWIHGMPATPVTGSLAALGFNFSNSQPTTMNGTEQQVWTFSGSGTSETINGTLIKTDTFRDAGGSARSASVTMPVTLTRQR